MPETSEINPNIRVLIPGAGVHELPADTPSNDITDYARGVYNSTVGAMGDLAHSYWNTTTSPAKTPGSNFINDLATAIYNGHVEQAHKAIDAFHEGRYSEAAGHTLAAATPVVGPAAAGIGEKIGSGKVAEGLGEATGLIGSVVAAGGEPEGGVNPANAEDFVPRRLINPEERATQDLIAKRLSDKSAKTSKYDHLDAAPDNAYDMSYADRAESVRKNASRSEPLSDEERTATAYLRRQRAPAHSGVEEIGQTSDKGSHEINVAGKTQGGTATPEAPASADEVRDFITKQFGKDTADAVLKDKVAPKATSAEVNKAAEKASTKFENDYKYSKSTSDNGLTTHKIDITDSEGKPVGAVKGIETDPHTVTIDQAQITKPDMAGKGIGTNAYKELIDQAHKQGKDVRSGAVRSDAANKVWKNLKENEGVDVRVLPDNSLIARAPKSAPKTAAWQAHAIQELSK